MVNLFTSEAMEAPAAEPFDVILHLMGDDFVPLTQKDVDGSLSPHELAERSDERYVLIYMSPLSPL